MTIQTSVLLFCHITLHFRPNEWLVLINKPKNFSMSAIFKYSEFGI